VAGFREAARERRPDLATADDCDLHHALLR
jgi:hypothetical protein